MNRRDIAAAFHALPEYRRFEALRLACADALEVWRRYRKDGKPLEYRDGVVGMRHTVDDRLPERALDEIDRYLRGQPVDPTATDTEYSEPIVAMQDDDLDVPRPVAQAYYAVYNLYRIVFRLPHAADDQVVLDQVAGSLDVDLDDWVSEWWTRAWDAWASLPELAYAPSDMTERAFGLLCAGHVDAAAAALDGVSCLRAVVLALAGRRDEAVAVAIEALGADSPELREWLADHVFSLAPDAIAVSANSTRYAVILGERLEIREHTGTAVQSEIYADRRLRFVRFRSRNEVWVAGDCVDPIGPWASFCASSTRGLEPPGFSLRGRRTIAALGNGEIVARNESEVVLIVERSHVIGAANVVGAAIHPSGLYVVTFDDQRVSMWPGTRLRQLTTGHPWRVLEGAARRVLLAEGYALVIWANGTTSIHELSD